MAAPALKLALAAAIGYALIVLVAYLVQRKLMYFPWSEHVLPAEVGLAGVRERIIATHDGQKVVAWYGPAEPGRPTILYFHGNGGNLALRSERIRRYLERGQGMFMMSYRGYSGSSGQPSEAANLSDARLAYEMLIAEGVEPRDIIVYGESLGTGIATRIAAERPVGGLILDSPFTSAVDVGIRRFPFLPISLLMQDRYEVSRYIARVRVPVLVIHGKRDQIVPFDMGETVFAAANEPKEFVPFAEAGHNNHSLHGSFEAVQAWIERVREGLGDGGQQPSMPQ